MTRLEGEAKSPKKLSEQKAFNQHPDSARFADRIPANDCFPYRRSFKFIEESNWLSVSVC